MGGKNSSKNHTNPKRERGRESSDMRPRSRFGLVLFKTRRNSGKYSKRKITTDTVRASVRREWRTNSSIKLSVGDLRGGLYQRLVNSVNAKLSRCEARTSGRIRSVVPGQTQRGDSREMSMHPPSA